MPAARPGIYQGAMAPGVLPSTVLGSSMAMDGSMALRPQQPVALTMDAARVLQRTMEELEHVRRQLRQPFSAKATVEAALSRLEADLKAQSQELFAAGHAAVTAGARVAAGSIPAAATFSPASSMAGCSSPSRKAMHGAGRTPAERVALFKADPFNRPQTDAARAYLQARFGVPTPHKPQQPNKQAAATAINQSGGAGILAKGLTTGSSTVILPASVRLDTYANVPAKLIDLELDKGLFHCVNRGLLPAKADLTPAIIGNNGPVQMGGVMLHHPAESRMKPPATSGLEDALLAVPAYKLDLITPIIKPDQKRSTAGSLHVTDMNAQQPGSAAGDAAAASTSQNDASDLARQYGALMDAYSLHEFMIRKGQLVCNTPEFESYQRTYEPLWPVIGPLISQLEMLSKQYALPLVVVDGRSLADLAHGVMDSGYPPQMQDLLVCVQNISEVAGLLRQPGRRFLGEHGRGDAATAIQAAWRGHTSRTRFSRRGLAAATIQAAWRMHRLRSQLSEKLTAARTARTARFTELQQQLVKQWNSLAAQPHVVVHVPSMRRPQPSTLSQKDALLVSEAAQFARLVDLAESLVEVILVLPGPPNPDVVAYWDKILQVGGVMDGTSHYRVVWPDNHTRLPAHMSTSAMMMASPSPDADVLDGQERMSKQGTNRVFTQILDLHHNLAHGCRSLGRLRAAVSGRLGYLLPGIPADEDVDLSVAMGLPMLAAPPHAARALCHKSAARALFRVAGVHVPPGLVVLPCNQLPPPPPRVGVNGAHPLTEHTAYAFTDAGHLVVQEGSAPAQPPSRTQYEMDEERVLQLLAEAAVRWPHVNQWVVKVDDEVGGGAGHAAFKISAVHGAADVLNRTSVEESARGPPPAHGPLPTLTEAQQVAVYRMAQLLYRHLPDRLAIAVKQVYPTYRDYISAVAVRGAVVEACPEAMLGSPQVNLLIDPTGGVALLSSHERIFVAPFRCVGSTFPQASVHPRALLDAATSIGAACFQAGVTGHLAVDFVTLLEHNHPTQAAGMRLWAVDVTPCPTPSLMAYQLFDFLTVGRWNPVTGAYLVGINGELEDSDATTDGSPSVGVNATKDETSIDHLPGQGAMESYQLLQQEVGESAAPMVPKLQLGTSVVSAGKKVPLAATLADAALRGERPVTAELPSGLPSEQGSSTYASTPAPGSTCGHRSALQSAGTGRMVGTPSTAYADINSTMPNSLTGSVLPSSRSEAAAIGLGAAAQKTLGRAASATSSVSTTAAMLPQTPNSRTIHMQRFFFALDALRHPVLASIPCTRFFRACWQDGLHYDVDSRTGVLFNLSDRYLLGYLGILTVGLAPHHIMATMQQVLAFISAKEREAAAGAGGLAGEPARAMPAADIADGIRSYREVQALVKYMADKSQSLVSRQ